MSDDTDIETEKRQADSEVAEMDSWVRSCILVGAGVCEADLDVEEWLLHSDKAFVVGAFDDKTVDGNRPHVRAYSATPSQQCGIGGVWIAWRPWVWTRGGALPPLTFCCPGSLRCAAAAGCRAVAGADSVPPPRRNYHDQNSGLTEVHLRFEIPIGLIPVTSRSRYSRGLAVGGAPPIMGAGARIRVLVDLRQDHGRVTFFLRDGASRRAASNSAGVAHAVEEEEGQGEGGGAGRRGGGGAGDRLHLWVAGAGSGAKLAPIHPQ
eukprot:COSAG01_NODE_3703_length_5778_cov_4.653812_5_plen_264_part_00